MLVFILKKGCGHGSDMNLLCFNLILQIHLLAKFPSESVGQNRVESIKCFVIYEHQFLDILQPQSQNSYGSFTIWQCY